MFKVRTYKLFSQFSCLVFSLFFLVITPVSALDYIRDSVPDAALVGEGRMKVMAFKIYDAALYAPRGEWQADKPFALRLSYLRDIEGARIVKRSITEIKAQGFDDQKKLDQWDAQMREIFPDVEVGTTITGVYDGIGATVFYRDGTKIGHIEDPDFSAWFFNIWLSENTRAPKLRRVLLGML